MSIAAWTPSYMAVPTPSGKSVVLIATAIGLSSCVVAQPSPETGDGAEPSFLNAPTSSPSRLG